MREVRPPDREWPLRYRALQGLPIIVVILFLMTPFLVAWLLVVRFL